MNVFCVNVVHSKGALQKHLNSAEDVKAALSAKADKEPILGPKLEELTTALSSAAAFLETLRNALASAPSDPEEEGSLRSVEEWLQWGADTKRECETHVQGLKHLLKQAKALA